MGIRTKIMLGFIILASMLFISGAISIFELTKLGHSIKDLLIDNYKSIDYSRNMLDALEKQEKSMLYLVEGNFIKSKGTFHKADKFFLENFENAKKNLTHKGELAYIDSIIQNYRPYAKHAKDALHKEELTLSTYLSDFQPRAHITNKHVKNLITINQQGLLKSATFLETSAQRAVIPGLIVIITSLVFTFIFIYLIQHYFVSPIIKITKGINDYVRYKKPFDIQLETRDELWTLKESVTKLISTCKIESKKSVISK
ncbi:MAG: MCP four helix bundle domain-containing protein [Bacteroidales bacterium]